jgi:glycosyltransferase involved in cell wall biosynthesis
MKVLWFTNTPCSAAEKIGWPAHRGGWLRSLEEAITKFDDIELYITFYSGKPFAPFKLNKTNYIPIVRENTGSKYSRYFKRIAQRPGSNDNKELQKLLEVVDTVKPDIIHVHGTEDNFGLIQEHISVPVVVSIQGIVTVIREKYYAGIPTAVTSKYDSLLKKITFQSANHVYKSYRSKATRERKILQHTKYVIGRTDWDRRTTRLLAPGSTYFVNNEILRSAFYTNQWNKDRFNNKITIVTISSGAWFKGFETIAKAASLLAAYPAYSFEWKVMGLNEKDTMVQLVKKWMAIDYENVHINLMGSANEEKIIDTLKQADIYCQVSHMENSPNSLCEAMILGMPVISSYAGGTASMLEDQKEGVLVQDGDAYALAGAIIEMSNDFKKAAEYGVRARQRSLHRHDRQSISKDLIDIYKNIGNHTS